MDGRTFLIPSYQRGYRWTEKEIRDFLSDLYSFALKPDKQREEFYCLQPIITQRFSDEDLIGLTLLEGDINTENTNVWTVIDGQQRLTSIFILYKYLLEKKGWSKEDLAEEESGKTLFHLAYETRKETTKFLENLAIDTLDDSDIDRSHISTAYRVIDEWVIDTGRSISDAYGRRNTPNAIREELFKLLNCPRGVAEATGSVQFIWYEIETSGSDSREREISEFLKINTGKIELTDAELLKALFLQKRNFEGGEKEIKQLQIAMEWEQIENTLHQNDFWHFFYGNSDRPNRIDALFELIYKSDKIPVYNDSIGNSIRAINKTLKVKNTLFRYYYAKFDGKSGDELQMRIREEWRKIMDAFHTLEDWYEDTKVYNFVGFLSHCGIDIAQMYIKFSRMPDTASKEDLEDFFIDLVKKELSGIEVENEQILATYSGNRNDIFKLLLFLNIDQQNSQYDKAAECEDIFNGDIFKFPFDVFDSQKWNVEHIDSYSTNQLRDTGDLRDWCETAIHELDQTSIPSVDKDRIKELFDLGSYKEIVERIKGFFEDDEEGEDSKNLIGNLTLLDERTNKSYGNSLFCTKKRIIQERDTNGTFVPKTTKWVFDKYFSGSNSTDIYWKEKDKNAYQSFIIKSIGQYLTIKNTSDEGMLF